MNRADLTIEVARIAGGAKSEAAKYVEAVIEGIKTGMKRDGEVKLANFATISTQEKPAHEGRNPMTGEKIAVPAKIIPKVKFSSALKNELNA